MFHNTSFTTNIDKMGCNASKQRVKIYGSDEVTIYDEYFSAEIRAMLDAFSHIQKHLSFCCPGDFSFFEREIIVKLNK